MSLPRLRQTIRDFYCDHNAFTAQQGTGLLSDVFPNTFTPSVGHPEAIQAVRCDPIPRLRNLIQDICFRAVDLNRVGFGPHLSLFEMSVSLWITDFCRENCVAEIERTFTNLVDALHLEPRNVLVTIYPGGGMIDTPIEADDWSRDAWCRLGIPPDNIIPAPGNACVLVPDTAGEPAGIRSEVFYRPATGAPPFEIATLEFLQYRMADSKGRKFLEVLPSCTGLCATAYGLERLEVAICSLDSIFDVEEVRVVLERVVDQAACPAFYAVQPYPFRVVADAYRAVTAILRAGQPLDQSRRGQIARNVVGRIRRGIAELGMQPCHMIQALLTQEELQSDWASVLLGAISAGTCPRGGDHSEHR